MRKSLYRAALVIFLLLCANASFAFTTILFVDESCDGSKAANFLSWVVVDPPPYTVLRDGVALVTTSNIFYRDTTAVPGSMHTYMVTSMNGNVTTHSNERLVQTPLCNRLPGRPVVTVSEICNLGVTPHRAGVHVAWTAAANADYYEVRRDNGVNVLQSLITTGLSFDDLSPLTPGHLYDYTVGVVTRLNGSNSSDQAFITTSAATACPPLPEAFALSSVAACDLNPAVPAPAVTLTWTKSLNAASYQILRDGAAYATASSTTYTDSNLVAGQTYAYVIRAINNSGSIDSNAITVPVSTSICHVPPAAFALSSQTYCISGDSPRSFVFWPTLKFTTTCTLVRDGVQVFASTHLPFPDSFEEVVVPGQTHTYIVRASNDYGATEASIAVNVPPTLCAPSPPTSLFFATYCEHNVPVVHATWIGYRYATGYQVFRDGAPVSPLLPGQTAAFDDRSAIAGASYKYTVASSNRFGAADSDISNVVVPSDVCPIPPRAFAVTARTVCETATAVRLEWTPVSNVPSYNVYRNGAVIGTASANAGTFTDTAVTTGQSYTYFLRGESIEAAYESNVLIVVVPVCQTVPPRHRGVRH
jgi:fibronectin type 3 domain-containing protein